MSRCNYCSMKEIRAKRKKGDKIHKVYNPPEMQHLGGTNVYLIPRGEEFNREKHFQSWFMEIPDHCCC